MSICHLARDTWRAHKKGDIDTEAALTILMSLFDDINATEFTDGYVHRAITLVTGVPIVEVEHIDPPQEK